MSLDERLRVDYPTIPDRSPGRRDKILGENQRVRSRQQDRFADAMAEPERYVKAVEILFEVFDSNYR